MNWPISWAAEISIESLVLFLGVVGLGIAAIGVRARGRKRLDSSVSEPSPRESPEPVSPTPPAAAPDIPKSDVRSDLRSGDSNWWRALQKTRARFSFSSSKEVEQIKEAFEEACLVSDLGVELTSQALESVDWRKIASSEPNQRDRLARAELAACIEPWLDAIPSDLQWPQSQGQPTVLWFVGVNGVGKTTTIAKIAHELKSRGKSVMLAAGDTFRAAAGSQLEEWATRLDIPIVKGSEGSDSSAVLFDAVTSAKAKNIDFLLCDSAGRLHNQSQLMDALGKNLRVLNKALHGAPHETLLVLDSNTGQNMIRQAEQFLAAVKVNGLVLTKLDGSARGGAVVAVARRFGLPIRRIGLGEKPEDLVAFNPKAFSQALLGLGQETD